MAKIFISYTRKDRAVAELYVEQLRTVYDHNDVWYDASLHGGEAWWGHILRQIDACDVFIFLISNRSLQSYYCQQEVQYAVERGKQILPVLISPRVNVKLAPPPVQRVINRLQYIPTYRLTNGKQSAALFAAVRRLLARATTAPTQRNETYEVGGNVDATYANFGGTININNPPSMSDPSGNNRVLIVVALIGAGGTIIAALIGVVGPTIMNRTPAPTQISVVGTTPASPAPNPTATPTRTAGQIAEATQTQAAADFQSTLDVSNLTEQAYEIETATAQAPTREAEQLATVDAILTATQAAVFALTPPATNAPDPVTLARTPVTRNADWTPVERDFDGVTMVLVPAGCFMMGSNDGDSDETPVHEQCFDEPFWIDKYEVTNAQYGGASTNSNCSSRSSEPDQPRNCIIWFDAQSHCENRGARLPTEREWEYAARGPDNLVYPWGNEFVADNAVYGSNSGGRTAPVGSRPGGASWVGAYDMSGNVWEWVSSLYRGYEYDASDGREDMTNRTDARVLRGGGFYGSTDLLRSADRDDGDPGNTLNIIGFRCARS